jgi:S1-C subfamily serine protease
LRTLFWSLAIVAAFFAAVRLAPVHSSSLMSSSRAWSSPTSSSPIWSGPASAASAYTSDEQNNIDVYRDAHSATVNITSKAYRQNWFMELYPVQGAGSGFIISADGEILTNNHVVRGSTELTVTLSDKKFYKARVLGVDEGHDLALIKIETGGKLPSLHLGDSDNVVVGQKVLAIGNPFGYGGTLTTGVVSSLDRSIQTEDSNQPLEGMIQTDAAINPGNSGGPLLNSHGDVIGINTAIVGQGNIGIGFAMPISRAKSMLEGYQKSGHVSPPTLGIREVYVSDDLAEMLEMPKRAGLLIQQVERGSAADTAGLRGPRQTVIVGNYPLGIGGDLIVAIDGQAVQDGDLLKRIMNRKHGGDMIEFTVMRNGRQEKIQVKLGSAPQKL